MPTILASLFSTPKFSVTNENTGIPVITGIKVKRVSIRLASKIPRHCKEDGSTIVDTRIIMQTVIMAEVMCPTLDDVNAVIQLQNDRENTYTIASRGLSFSRMMAQVSDMKQSAEVISAAPMQIVFKQLLVQGEAAQEISQQAGDAAGINAGIQSTNTTVLSPQLLVQRLTASFTSFINGGG